MSNRNEYPNYNVSGWGNTQFSVPLDKQKEVAEYAEKHTTYAAAKRYGISQTTAWRIMQLYKHPSKTSIKDQGEYDKDFRMRACVLAQKHDVRTAAMLMGCSTGSIYNWLKVYKMTNTYFNPMTA